MGLVVTRYDTACRRRMSYSQAVRAGDYFFFKLKIKFLLYGHVMCILIGYELRGCFECTLWNVLTDDSDLDNNVEVVSDYINFCEDMIIPKKEVKCYPNNKPWVTKGLKETINKKKSALAKKDKLALKTVGNELKIQIR